MANDIIPHDTKLNISVPPYAIFPLKKIYRHARTILGQTDENITSYENLRLEAAENRKKVEEELYDARKKQVIVYSAKGAAEVRIKGDDADIATSEKQKQDLLEITKKSLGITNLNPEQESLYHWSALQIQTETDSLKAHRKLNEEDLETRTLDVGNSDRRVASLESERRAYQSQEIQYGILEDMRRDFFRNSHIRYSLENVVYRNPVSFRRQLQEKVEHFFTRIGVKKPKYARLPQRVLNAIPAEVKVVSESQPAPAVDSGKKA
ncbi:MAG: hypothetical protein V1743_07065 [Nanoarchaeota archaeon]